MSAKALKRAREIVERRGIVLVFPVANEKEPRSLWSELHPRAVMRWAWDSGADSRVVDLWHLRNELAASGDVAYGKWFRGRATFFSLDVFHALLARLAESGDVFAGLPHEAREILELLRERSPMSTKELREAAGLRGKPLESLFSHATRMLWSRLLTVGVGEVEGGAFPSLAIAATEMMFEDLWAARTEVPSAARSRLEEILVETPAFRRVLARTCDELSSSRGEREDEDL